MRTIRRSTINPPPPISNSTLMNWTHYHHHHHHHLPNPLSRSIRNLRPRSHPEKGPPNRPLPLLPPPPTRNHCPPTMLATQTTEMRYRNTYPTVPLKWTCDTVAKGSTSTCSSTEWTGAGTVGRQKVSTGALAPGANARSATNMGVTIKAMALPANCLAWISRPLPRNPWTNASDLFSNSSAVAATAPNHGPITFWCNAMAVLWPIINTVARISTMLFAAPPTPSSALAKPAGRTSRKNVSSWNSQENACPSCAHPSNNNRP